MRYELAFHQVDHSDAFESWLRRKLEKMSRFLNENEQLRFVASKNGREFEVSLNAMGEHPVHLKSRKKNVYQAGAEVMRRFKNLLHSHRH